MPTIEERLAAAEAARDALLSGRARVEVQAGSERVRYQVADLAALDRHIAELKAEAGAGRRRAIRLGFR